MRFFENGPAIPDELLHARDEGRVVFFCGAGVSQAKAGLPGFFGLAEKVMETLGVLVNSPARELLEEAHNGVASVISADRIFGLLEREFSTDVIEAAVASALRPSDDNPDLTAHRTILDLATTREGLVHIVTTNFDRLFDDCGRDLSSWQRSRLPDPSRPRDMNGIVYLHGKVTPDYKKAEDAGFVLSSSQFGQAYLSEGWATSFFREIIDKYVVVFVGYAADDPPVHYLLEGLNRQINERQVYAFQPGEADEAAAKWGHRGVEAISYGEDHTALWNTLEAWAQRARDPDEWYSEIINKAKQGPQSLSPHERGQVAHIVSTVEGARKFSEGEEPPPAEWLCVFDKYRRYGEPGRLGSWLQEGPEVDPFDLYRIDSDVPPDKSNSDGHFDGHKVPDGAWDAFALNHLDKTNLSDDYFPSITGRWAYNVPPLPSRLRQMGEWIKDVAGQPAAVWWAVRQPPLHPDIRRTIRLALTDSQRPISPAVREAWYYLLEYWEQGRGRNADLDSWHKLKGRISKDGWSKSVVRAYAACYRPYLQVEPSWGNPKPPEQDRITWLSQKGCQLRLNLEDETNRLREFVPDWKPEYADERVGSWGIKGGSVSTDTDYSALLDIPLASVLSKARSLSGRRDNPFVEYNPFGGLSADRPVRAFSALRMAAKEGDFPAWAWSTFLTHQKNDNPRLVALIAERLACYLDGGATELVRPAASWLFNVSEHLSDESPASFRRVTSVLIQALKVPENRVATAIVFNAPPEELKQERERELVQTAVQTAQAVAQALFHTQKTDLLKYADELLTLPTGLRQHVLAIFARWMNWFYVNNREWSEANLLSALDSRDLGDRDAFWGGFFLRPKVNQELFMRLKPHLFQLAREDSKTRREHSQGLASIILSGWGSIIEGTNERCISNEEFREILLQADDEFRPLVLWLLEKCSRDDVEETRNKWTALLPEFLKDVWPRQRKANSSAISVSLCQLVLSNEELFPNLIDIILLCLTKTDDLRYRHYLSLSDNIAQKHPHQMLNLLYKVLPDETLTWPYEIGDVLTSISEGEPTLRTDEKFLELKRRWDSR